jgi:hypothetical protein
MPHELRGIEHQSAEFYTQLFTAGLVFAVVVLAFAYYLHRKHGHLLKRPPHDGKAVPRKRKRHGRRPRY